MDASSQALARMARLEMVRTELSNLGAQFLDMKRDVAEVVRNAAARRDERLMEQTRKDLS